MTRNTKTVAAGSDNTGPALTGNDDEALLQAMRNLWPILSPEGRKQATQTANRINPER